MDTKFRRLAEEDYNRFKEFGFFRGLAVGLAISVFLWAIIVALFVW